MGAWARSKQFESPRNLTLTPQSYYDDSGFAGFAIQPRLFDRNGKIIEATDAWRGQITPDNGNASNGSWHGDKNGGIYFGSLNPYAKKGTLQLTFVDPKRPPEADGTFSSRFLWPNLAYPTQVNTFLPVNRTFETAHGSKITLLGYGRYETGLSESADGKRLGSAGIYSFVRSIKPDFPKGVILAEGNMKLGARDGKIDHRDPDDLKAINGYHGDLHLGKGLSSDRENEVMTHVFATPDTPRPLHLQMQFLESHPSWKQPQYFPTFSFPLDFSAFPMPSRDAKFASVATAKNAGVEVALDLWQDRSDEATKKNYLAWFWTRDLKIKDDPSLRWVVEGGAARPEIYLSGNLNNAKLSDGINDYRAAPRGWSQWTWRFRPDGSPILGSEYRPSVSFSTDAIKGAPQRFDMSVKFAQWRIKRHSWGWKAVPLPTAGQKLTLNRSALSPTGVKVKIVHVAVYEPSRRFAGIETILDGQANPLGVVVSFEAENAQFTGPKKFEPWETSASVRPDGGPAWNTLAIRKGDSISGAKNEAKIARWTWIYPLKKLEANSFDLDLSWDADYLTGRTATFDFSNLSAPVKDSR